MAKTWFVWHIPSTSAVTTHPKTFHHSNQVLSLPFIGSFRCEQWLCDRLAHCWQVHQLQRLQWGQKVLLKSLPRMICASFQMQQSLLTCGLRRVQILTADGQVCRSPNHY